MKIKLSLLLLFGFSFAVAQAHPVPQNLGNGLNKILENSLLQAGTIAVPAPAGGVTPTQAYVNAYKAAVLKEATAFDARAIKENVTGKYLVDIMPNGQVPVATLQTQLQAAFPALNVRQTDGTYAGHGIVEGYILLSDASAIAKFNGVRSIVLQLKPIHSVGAVTSQGINQHRVNRINTTYNPASAHNWDGMGMFIGVMSDSFNSQPSAEGGFTTAQADVLTGDLPGTGNLNNPTPVVVIEDYNPTPGATNEGRAMCQIVADIAPKATIGFATADTGELGFANNIRKLGGLLNSTFHGDVVCDDVSYLDEPMFQDGIIAQGVIDVVNAGVSYCSSAANNWGTDGYDSTFRPVTGSAATAAIATAGLNFTGVDPNLYAGGFHNFNPNAGQVDITQTFNSSSDPQAAVFQWSDPYDTTVPTLVNPPLYSTTGDSEPAPLGNPETTFTIPTPLTAGHAYVVTEMATPADPSENFDAIVAVIDPNGNTILDQDTGVDETVVFFAQVSGTYKVRVHAFATTPPIIGQPAVSTRGHYSLAVNDTTGAVPRITQDFNLLFFDLSGNFLEAVASNNFANNRPYEVWVPDLSSFASQVQLVIARANNTAPPTNMELKYVFFGNGAGGMGPVEYNNYLTPVTFGHSAAAGGNSVAAYSMFRPNLPEDFTSPGPVTIYFDTSNNALPVPQIRLKPDVAAADGANNTFFPLGPAQDAPWDMDAQYANFYGTSAASPHAAAIAALVIQAHGGHGSLTPAQVKALMQLTAFPHDLDPYFASGAASAHDGTVTVSAASDNDSNAGTGANDSNTFAVTYSGSGYVKEIHFNPNGAAGEAGNPSGGNYIGGTAPGTPAEYSDFLNSANYNFTPGLVFNSNQYVNGTKSDVSGTATWTNPAPAPSTNAFKWTLNITFPANGLVAGKTFRFNDGRNQQQDATAPQGQTIENPLYGQTATYSADNLGSGILIPEYADNPIVLPGMKFSGVITDGGTDYPFTGVMSNKIGKSYSPLDGYGFINAQAATAGVVPVAGVVSRKVHGTAGTFDIPLPLTGTAGIECRNPGPGNTYQLVFTFDRNLQNAGSAAITQGSGNAPTTVAGPETNQVTVNLTGVTTSPQHLIVTLSNVRDSVGNAMAAMAARMDLLIGDTSGDGSVNSADISQTKARSGQTVGASNFRSDVSADGSINSADISLVKSKSGTALP